MFIIIIIMMMMSMVCVSEYDIAGLGWKNGQVKLCSSERSVIVCVFLSPLIDNLQKVIEVGSIQ